ncbi:UDP-N-acetylmuramate--L-alanine ligase [Paenibacillus psychroresistens]|uniref:UDP-N-acetylmuramate--L-alanine ligase n=1 Tax=Paenibacillus psychroresistens TaxID=1778678 RepID=A0A6B8RVT9_9BACL|nr:UDP-N-acetylmuramate--L-alanine ligase [Paenibacillus psychroresistens]QGR00038.1 UDP-N-acetylmuramate--L-alanine ligase [Paenibacillus psychroresistens]
MKAEQHVHFIGIGGYGMSAIAKVMLEIGFKVSGSDVAHQELTEKLIAQGATVYLGHEAVQVEGADLVVYSTALAKDNIEVQRAEQLGIPVIHRSEMLARLMNERKGIAIAGAHGKTTTSSMISLVMHLNHQDPTYIIGGEIMNLGSNAKAGKGEYVIAEADESDGSFLQYTPNIAVVINIEADHLENYDGDFNKLKLAYAQFLSQVKDGGKAVVCLDDPNLKEMLPHLKSKVVTYGIKEQADYRAANIQLGDRKVSFDVFYLEAKLGQITLSVPGKHNVYNALATLITCLEAGLSFEQIANTITEFNGAKRRYQVLGDVDGILVIDDYAHHPTEIEATIAASKASGKKIIAVFQPQRYTRTFYLFDQFSRAFAEADEVIITDIYSPAGEKQIEGITSAKLVELIRINSNPQVTYFPSKEEVQAYLINHVQSGDLVLTMGAGDIWKAAVGLVKGLKSKSLT